MPSHLNRVDLTDKNLFLELHKFNLIDRLKNDGILGKTFTIDQMTKKIRPIIPLGVDANTPWVHPKQDPNRNCTKWQMIERVFDFIPTPCLDCWKVVVRPRNIFELFQLYNIMVDMNEERDVYCKCGIELDRPWVHSLYGGYFYNDSEQEGQEKKKQVRALVDKQIGKEVPVILKRFCTEFEIKHGSSKGYSQPKEAKVWEKLIDKHYEETPKHKEQPIIVVQDVMQRWIEFAQQYADPVFTMFNNGESLYTQVQTY